MNFAGSFGHYSTLARVQTNVLRRPIFLAKLKTILKDAEAAAAVAEAEAAAIAAAAAPPGHAAPQPLPPAAPVAPPPLNLGQVLLQLNQDRAIADERHAAMVADRAIADERHAAMVATLATIAANTVTARAAAEAPPAPPPPAPPPPAPLATVPREPPLAAAPRPPAAAAPRPPPAGQHRDAGPSTMAGSSAAVAAVTIAAAAGHDHPADEVALTAGMAASAAEHEARRAAQDAYNVALHRSRIHTHGRDPNGYASPVRSPVRSPARPPADRPCSDGRRRSRSRSAERRRASRPPRPLARSPSRNSNRSLPRCPAVSEELKTDAKLAIDLLTIWCESGQNLKTHIASALPCTEHRSVAVGIINARQAENKRRAAAGERTAGELTNAELLTALSEAFNVQVRTEVVENSLLLLKGKVVMSAQKGLTEYITRFRNCAAKAHDLPMANRILVFQNGLTPEMRPPCMVDYRGLEFTDFEVMCTHALGEELKLRTRRDPTRAALNSAAAGPPRGRRRVRTQDHRGSPMDHDRPEDDFKPAKKQKPFLAAASTDRRPGARGASGGRPSNQNRPPVQPGRLTKLQRADGSFLTAEQWQKAKAEGRCARCDQKGHMMRDCPKPAPPPPR